MITAIFFGLVIYAVTQFVMALNQAIVSGDKIWEDKQRLKSLALIIGIPLGIAFLVMMFFKSKIKFK